MKNLQLPKVLDVFGASDGDDLCMTHNRGLLAEQGMRTLMHVDFERALT
jgi:hypothetical protein